LTNTLEFNIKNVIWRKKVKDLIRILGLKKWKFSAEFARIFFVRTGANFSDR